VAWGGSGGTVWVFEIGAGTFINYDKLPNGGTAYSGWTGIASAEGCSTRSSRRFSAST